VIASAEAFDLLVEACPSYFAAESLDRYVAAFEEQATPDLFVRISAFALHVVDLLAAGATPAPGARAAGLVPRPDLAAPGELDAVFVTVERLLTDGDEDTVELVTLGFLETVQNVVSHDDVAVSAATVFARLGPEAARVWLEHEELWNEAARWRHDGPRVDIEDYEGITDPNLRRYFQTNKRRMPDGALIGASDIVHYQSELQGISPITPAGRPRIPWAAVAVGLVLAICVAIAKYR
jgi:hypothetical protein